VTQLIIYYVMYALVPALIAFGIVWSRQKASLPEALGWAKIIGVFVALWCTATGTIFALEVIASFAHFEKAGDLEGTWVIISIVVAFAVGMVLVKRLLRSVQAPTVDDLT